jgi:hypothetical protein
VGFFGGLSYAVPAAPLKILIEYSGDKYAREVGLGTLYAPSPINLGLEWQASKNSSLTVSWLRGDSIGINLSAKIDTKANLRKKLVLAFILRWNLEPSLGHQRIWT